MKVVALFLLFGICSWVSAWDYQSLGLSWADSSHADYDATCAGSRQSPINIVRSEATVVGQDDLPRLRKTCSLVEGKFTNNGHTLKFELTDGKAVFSEKEYLSGGPYGSVKYFFLQFHLHWGSTDCEGSEHTVDSNRFPAELHMVHVKEDHVSQDGTVDLNSALAAEDGLAVLGIFITGGADSAAWFDVIANATKDIADSNDQSTETVLATVNLNQIVQRINPTFSGDFNYWYYNGSLTTPSCQEAVHWVVAEKALQVTDDQLAELYRLTDDNSTPLLNNFRLTQPISAGDVYYVDINEETESVYQSDCTCNLRGTVDFDCTCNSETSQCVCDSSNGYTGTECDSCLSGWYWTDSSSTCTGCGCNLSGTTDSSSTCDDESGENCSCSGTDGYSGGISGKCDDCLSGWYWTSSDRMCNSCGCNSSGTTDSSSTCDDNSGECSCQTGYSGTKCDECSSGYKLSGSTCIEECFDVTCSFTIDDVTYSASYEGQTLDITTVNLGQWFREKTVNFVSCGPDPGSIVISGKDNNGGGHCTHGGLVLHCTANDTSTPWHNFVSDGDYWLDEQGFPPCARDMGGILEASQSFVDDIAAAGALSIWADRPEVTLTGSPGEPNPCLVTCSFTIDDVVISASYNGSPLVISGQLDKWFKVNQVIFECPTGSDPGELVIAGQDNNNGGHCTFGGLVMHCVAEDESNAWHDFVSDGDNWLDENDQPPCAESSGGFLDAGQAFVDAMLAKGAQKIWADRKLVTLTGSPS